jgi:AcrR family transcriptional regulator
MITSARSKPQRRTTRKTQRRAGRPTTEETARLSHDVAAAALDLFLEHGYEGTTLDAIARAAGTTKPSLYVRFTDKEALYASVLQWAIGRSDWPVPKPAPPDYDDLEGSLRAIAEAALRRATHPDMVKLTRVVVAQADRFPVLAELTSAARWPHRQWVVELLQRHGATGAILAEDPEILAEHFLGLVSDVPARQASFGIVRSQAAWTRANRVAIDLFLRGLRPA